MNISQTIKEAVTMVEVAEQPKAQVDLCDKKILLSDIGNADRFLLTHGDNIRHSPEIKTWYTWSGTHWQVDETSGIMRLAIQTAREFKNQATAGYNRLNALKSPTEAEQKDLAYFKALKSFAVKSTFKSRVSAMVELAQSMKPIQQKDLDTQHHLLTVRNGTLDLRTGRLGAHRREDYITKMVDFDYNPKTDCPTFKAFLSKIFANDAELINYLQTVFGYCLTGETKEQSFFIGYGSGANGKSTLIETLAYILGDHAQTVPSAVLMEQDKRGGEASPELARLKGKRFAICSESKDSQRLNESQVKALTGNEVISCRPLFSQGFEYQPTYKIWLSTNHKPIIKNTDNGIWRRVKLIPFNITIPESEQDKNLMQKLQAEAVGILAWLVDGAVRYYKNGLKTPQAVQASTADYRAESDTLQGFLDDCIVKRDNYFLTSAKLFEAYTKWANFNGIEPIKQNLLSRKMTEKGYKIDRTATARGIFNIDVKIS